MDRILQHGHYCLYGSGVKEMTKGETIAYALAKEACRYSLTEWLEEWEISPEDFDKFMEAGKAAVDTED